MKLGYIRKVLTLLPLTVCLVTQGQVITADENGNGSIDTKPLTGFIVPDSGLVYPFETGITVRPGDVVLRETPGGAISDVIRFINIDSVPPQGGFIFFSDPVGDNPGDTDLADVLGLPTNVDPNAPSLVEGASYAPNDAQPGFIVGQPGAVYNFISDVESVPDSGATLGLLAVSLAGLAGLRRRLSC